MSEAIDFGALDTGASTEELSALRQSQSFLSELLQDPEARQVVVSRYKAKHPEAFVPEYDVPKQTEALMKPTQERLAAIERERADERATRFWDDVRGRVSASSLPEGSFDDVQKLMTEQGIANPDVAIAYLVAQQKPRSDAFDWRTTLPGSESDEDKGLLEDPRGWARNKAFETITHLQQQAR